jgi:hypothetical protein
MKTQRIALIADFLKLDRYAMTDFWAVCPFEPDDFSEDVRPADLRSWRQVGMVWGRLSGLTTQKAGKAFYKDHATVIHAEKIVLDTLIDKRKGCRYVYERLMELVKHCTYPQLGPDTSTNEAISLVWLQNKMNETPSN